MESPPLDRVIVCLGCTSTARNKEHAEARQDLVTFPSAERAERLIGPLEVSWDGEGSPTEGSRSEADVSSSGVTQPACVPRIEMQMETVSFEQRL